MNIRRCRCTKEYSMMISRWWISDWDTVGRMGGGSSFSAVHRADWKQDLPLQDLSLAPQRQDIEFPCVRAAHGRVTNSDSASANCGRQHHVAGCDWLLDCRGEGGLQSSGTPAYQHSPSISCCQSGACSPSALAAHMACSSNAVTAQFRRWAAEAQQRVVGGKLLACPLTNGVLQQSYSRFGDKLWEVHEKKIYCGMKLIRISDILHTVRTGDLLCA